MKALTPIAPKILLPGRLKPIHTNLKELTPAYKTVGYSKQMSQLVLCPRKLTVLPWHPLRRVASRFAADLDKNIAVMCALLGVGRGHSDVAFPIAEVIDGVEGVGVFSEAFDCVYTIGTDAYVECGNGGDGKEEAWELHCGGVRFGGRFVICVDPTILGVRLYLCVMQSTELIYKQNAQVVVMSFCCRKTKELHGFGIESLHMRSRLSTALSLTIVNKANHVRRDECGISSIQANAYAQAMRNNSKSTSPLS
jgi:hypothetical protein